MSTILIVEDDKLLRKAIQEELEEANFEVFLAETGPEVDKILTNNHVDLIYLDVMLPGDEDGFAILRRLKSSSSPFQMVKIIMLTNLGQMDQIDQGMNLGATDYIVKASINLSRLVNITKEKLGQV